MENAEAGAPRVNVDDAVPLNMARLMRVPADNHVELRRHGIEIQLRNIVKYVYQGRTGLGHCGQRQLVRPVALIDVLSNGDDRRQ